MGLEIFFQDCKKIDERLLKLQLNPDFAIEDNRRICFGVLRSQIMHYEIMLHILKARYTQSIQPPKVFEEIIGIGYDPQEPWEEFQVISKVNLISTWHFIIENFFKTLLVTLDNSKDPPIGFHGILVALLDSITITDKDITKDTFDVLSLIRNSFHSNGIHVPLHPSLINKVIVINNETFTFVKGNPTEIGEPQLAVVLNEIIDALEKIVNSIEIKQLSQVPKLFIPRI